MWCEDLEEIIYLALNKACCWRPTLDGRSFSLYSLLSPSEFAPAPQNLICSVVSFLAVFVSLSHWSLWPASQALGIPRVSGSLQNWGGGLKESVIRNETTKGRCGGNPGASTLLGAASPHSYPSSLDIWSLQCWQHVWWHSETILLRFICSETSEYLIAARPYYQFSLCRYCKSFFPRPQVPEGLICANNICPHLTQMLVQAHTHM